MSLNGLSSETLVDFSGNFVSLHETKQKHGRRVSEGFHSHDGAGTVTCSQQRHHNVFSLFHKHQKTQSKTQSQETCWIQRDSTTDSFDT